MANNPVVERIAERIKDLIDDCDVGFVPTHESIAEVVVAEFVCAKCGPVDRADAVFYCDKCVAEIIHERTVQESGSGREVKE